MTNRRLVLDFDALAADVLHEVGEILKADGKRKMDTVSKGSYEYSHKVKRFRWVSKVGDAPNNETGDLNSTIRYKINGREMEYGSGVAGTKISYAKFLENRGKLNRPNITNAVFTGQRKIEAALERKFMDHVRWNDD